MRPACLVHCTLHDRIVTLSNRSKFTSFNDFPTKYSQWLTKKNWWKKKTSITVLMFSVVDQNLAETIYVKIFALLRQNINIHKNRSCCLPKELPQALISLFPMYIDCWKLVMWCSLWGGGFNKNCQKRVKFWILEMT